jgi:hypothetical protein
MNGLKDKLNQQINMLPLITSPLSGTLPLKVIVKDCMEKKNLVSLSLIFEKP